MINENKRRNSSKNKRNGSKKIMHTTIPALKIATGSCISMYIARQLQLDFAASAGTITLLTLLTTRWETLKLSCYRLLSFVLSVFLCRLLFRHMPGDWLAYGMYVFLISVIFTLMDWRAVISVNAVIGTHFLETGDFSPAFIRNELALVIIGIFFAILLNLFQNNAGRRKKLLAHVRLTEGELKKLLEELAAYLSGSGRQDRAWEDLELLESRLEGFREQAYEYRYNILRPHAGYYLRYFEMRTKQCLVLCNLHGELIKLSSLPGQAAEVASFMEYCASYIHEPNDPKAQLARLHGVMEQMKAEPLPGTREEFENRAALYHVLMDLEDFLLYKRTFVETMDERLRSIYWEQRSAR